LLRWPTRQRTTKYWKLRHKVLVKSNYKKPTNGKFDDCPEKVLTDLQAEDNSKLEEVLVENKTRKDRKTVLTQNNYYQTSP